MINSQNIGLVAFFVPVPEKENVKEDRDAVRGTAGFIALSLHQKVEMDGIGDDLDRD